MSDLVKNQSDVLLTTKLNPPLIRSDILDRPHLIKILEQDVRRPLTVITAPAGYGKSTLAAQWLETSALPGVWVSLDKEDNDTRVFLSYFVAAVQRRDPHACPHSHDLLKAPVFPPAEVIAKLLSNDLEEMNKPFLLVLDDYHLVTSPEVYDILDRLLQHPPRSLHLVIVTRRDPPFPMISMKARGLAVEIRESDLQFDATETSRLLERVSNITLDEKNLTRIMNDIEGWITGLRLYCLARDQGETGEVYTFGRDGGPNSVQEYLVEQVLSNQPSHIRDCLLKTSILDRFCAPLCEAVCMDSAGRNTENKVMTGHEFMEIISKAKLFGIQLETGGKWVRYHHLFQELLHNHLQRKSEPQQVAVLHRRAAKWFSEQSLIDEGLKHAHAAGDSELAARIIEDARLEALNTDKWPRLGKWLNSLPTDIENSRPHLLMSRAYVLMQSLSIAEIPAVLEQVVALEGNIPVDPMLAGELNFFRGLVSFFMGEVEACKRHLEAALRTIPETNLEARSESEYFSYVALHIDGQREAAVQCLQAAIQRNEPRSFFYQTRLMFGLSFVHALAGQWPKSAQSAEHLAEFSQPNELAYALSWAIYMQGNACLQMLELEDANRYLTQTFERRYINNRRAVVDALVGQALCLQLLGREKEADQCLHEARGFAYWTGEPAHLDVVDSGRARVALLRGDVDLASRWLAAFHGKPDSPVKLFFLEIPGITACSVLVAKGTKESLDQADTWLESLEVEARRFHHNCHLVPVLVLKSLLYSKTNRVQDALDILTEAVDLAWPGRWTLPFIEGGQAVAELLRQLPQNPEWGGFIDHTLSRYDQQQGNVTTQPSKPAVEEALIIDLTNREMDVLELLCKRLYDKEIADRLFISPATVKTHLSHIYGKLQVTNRREAAIRARQLKLV